MRPGTTRIIITVVWSAAVWVALWGDLSAGPVLAGLVIGALVAWAVPTRPTDRRVPLRPVAVLRFVGFFAWALVKASAVVAWEIVTPGSRINEGIVAAPLKTRTDGVITLIANAISLTPGTLTIDVRRDPTVLYVHVLHLGSFQSARDEIARLEELAIAAFEPVDVARKGGLA